MKHVIFELAGNQRPADRVYLQSRHRKQKMNTTVMHNNSVHTVLRMPQDFFKVNFSFDHTQSVYRNSLTWADLVSAGYVTVHKLTTY